MTHYVRSFVCALALLIAGAVASSAQAVKFDTGQNIVPVFEGWQRLPDGSYKFHFGYLNRNYQEILDVRSGPTTSSTRPLSIAFSRPTSTPGVSVSSSPSTSRKTGTRTDAWPGQ